MSRLSVLRIERIRERHRSRSSFLSRRVPLTTAFAATSTAALVVLASVESARAVRAHLTEPGALFVTALVVVACASAAVAIVCARRCRLSFGLGAAFVLAAHGATLALHGVLVGVLFAGIAPVIAAFAHATLPSAWKPRPPTAPDAGPAASDRDDTCA